MKKKIVIYDLRGKREKEILHIPLRFILAMMLILAETLAVLGIVIWCAIHIPYFYLAMALTHLCCILQIINSQENPEYKIPWLMVVLVIPVAGFMIYLMFYDRKLSKKYIKRLTKITQEEVKTKDEETLEKLENEDYRAYMQAGLLRKMSRTHIYQNTKAKYFDMGEKMHVSMLEDLKKAKKFIFLEYFIIEEGKFWNSILEILKEKANQGVDVRVLYDDIGCMCTLPGNYCKTLKNCGIKAVSFARLKGQANNEFNNRSHRKIMVIDGEVGYTGGVNIADEYINEIHLYGLWKDVGIRLEGEAVVQLTSIFLSDYEMNVRTFVPEFAPYFWNVASLPDAGYVIPFRDGPAPLYKQRVAKVMIMNMLSEAEKYVYMMTPYLIIDNELCQAIENAALKGIDVRIITPHIPDKKLVFTMTRSHYKRLMDAGALIYEFEPGFVHAKVYISDDKYAIVGTVNMDYRSLVHHFENGVWLYKHDVLSEVKADFLGTMEQSIEITDGYIKENLLQKLIRTLVRVFSPML